MVDRKRKILALKEAVLDTAIALMVNTPLNFGFIAYAYHLEMTAFQTSLWLTTMFTVFAIVRKYLIRILFDKKHG